MTDVHADTAVLYRGLDTVPRDGEDTAMHPRSVQSRSDVSEKHGLRLISAHEYHIQYPLVNEVG